MEEQPAPLDVLKALGDNTRYAIYLELARSSVPRSTAEVAESLGLHVNTVRPQMERMREVGLLEVAPDHRGAPGRPQHRYSIAPDSPSLGLEPPTFPMLARMLVGVAARVGAGTDDAVAAGREQGAMEVSAYGDLDGPACVGALVSMLDRLGFDPETVSDQADTTVAFTRCPFRELAEAHPELVCGLHRGLIEGFVAAADGGVEVTGFGSLVDRHPCRVQLSGRTPVASAT